MPPKKKGEKRVEVTIQDLIKDLPLTVTGVRPGEFIEGFKGNAEGGTLLIKTEDNYPPSRDTLQLIWDATDDEQSQFFRRIRTLPFFSTKTNKEIRDYLEEEAEEQRQYNMGDRDGDKMHFIALPKKLIEIFKDESYQQKILKEPISYNDLNKMIIEENGTTILALMNKWWRVLPRPLEIEKKNFDGWVVNLNLKSKSKEKSQIIVLEGVKYEYYSDDNKKSTLNKIGVYLGDNPKVVDYDKIIASKEFDSSKTSIKRAIQLLNKLTPAGLKSLLQKLIRFRPKYVALDTQNKELISAIEMLWLTCVKLAQHPGAFNPDTGSFNSGLESLLKRLAVISVEDTCPQSEEITASLMWGAYIARRIKRWDVPEELIFQWLDVATDLYLETNRLDYKRDEGKRLGTKPLSNRASPLEQCVSLLGSEFLGSMEGDRFMFRDLSHNYEERLVELDEEFVEQEEVMPIWHCVDQHWATGIVYVTDSDFIIENSNVEVKSAPFRDFFGILFGELTGLNPRRDVDLEEHLGTSRTAILKEAQARFWNNKIDRSLTSDVDLEEEIDDEDDEEGEMEEEGKAEIVSINHGLHPSWLSGLIGEMTTGVADTVSCLRIDNLEEVIPIKKLSKSAFRNKQEAAKKMIMTPEQEERSIAVSKERLGKGVALLNEFAPSEEFFDQETYYNEEEKKYYIRKKGSKVKGESWDTFRQITRNYQGITISKEGWESGPFYAYSVERNGVAEDHEERLLEILREVGLENLQYALRYLDIYDLVITMPKIMRDGSGEKEAIGLKLVTVNKLLLYLAIIYPEIISCGGIGSFILTHLPSYRWIVNRIRKFVLDNSQFEGEGWGDQFKDTKIIDGRLRELMTHQVQGLEKMKTSHQQGIKGHFIWTPVGSGKTMLALSYLQFLKDNDSLPSHIIYALPRSAFETVIDEILAFSTQINVLDRTLKGDLIKSLIKRDPSLRKNPLFLNQLKGKNCKPLPNCINLIEHNHVRECPEELREVASDAVVVIDEIHDAINQITLRTNNLMILARLSYEFIGMTGTAIINNDIYQLMPWMRLIVPYTVRQKNYFTTLTGLIAHKVNTGHKVNLEEIRINYEDWPEDLLEQYQELMPPELGGHNPNKSQANFQLAMSICYNVTNNYLVGMTLLLLRKGIRVMLVSLNKSHSETLCKKLIEHQLAPKDIFMLAPESNIERVDAAPSINLTQQSVDEGKNPPYQVVIVPKNRGEGYSLTYLRAMVQAPYPNNQSKRDQLSGRINRVEAKTKTLYYFTFHTGLTTYMLKYHGQAATLRDFYQQMAKEIKLGELLDIDDSDTKDTIDEERDPLENRSIRMDDLEGIIQRLQLPEPEIDQERDDTKKDSRSRSQRTSTDCKKFREENKTLFDHPPKDSSDWKQEADECICKVFKLDQTRNPLTNRQIKPDGDKYKAIDKWTKQWCPELVKSEAKDQIEVAEVILKKEEYQKLIQQLKELLGKEILEIILNFKLHRDHPDRGEYLKRLEKIIPDSMFSDTATRKRFKVAMMRRALEECYREAEAEIDEEIIEDEEIEVSGVTLKREQYTTLIQQLKELLGKDILEIILNFKLHRDHPNREEYLKRLEEIIPDSMFSDSTTRKRFKAAMMQRALKEL